MKQFLLSFLLTSFSTSILVLFLSLIFAALKTKISVKVKYLILLSFLFPFRPQFGSGLIRLSTGATVQTVVRAGQTSGGQAVSQVAGKASQASLWEYF